jgi:1-acyl-sn-glycerol-3-phosphate acyltransferase
MNPLKYVAKAILKLCGWSVLDGIEKPRHAVVIAYPHTSNWDFPWAVLGLAALGFRPRWVGKDTMFRGWRGPIMRFLGGVAVNRRERTGFVARVAEEFSRHDEFMICIAPEGTRGMSGGWKSGFYRIARAANVPVMAAVLDYSRREVGFVGRFDLTGDETADLEKIAQVYVGAKGRAHEKSSPIRFES